MDNNLAYARIASSSSASSFTSAIYWSTPGCCYCYYCSCAAACSPDGWAYLALSSSSDILRARARSGSRFGSTPPYSWNLDGAALPKPAPAPALATPPMLAILSSSWLIMGDAINTSVIIATPSGTSKKWLFPLLLQALIKAYSFGTFSGWAKLIISRATLFLFILIPNSSNCSSSSLNGLYLLGILVINYCPTKRMILWRWDLFYLCFRLSWLTLIAVKKSASPSKNFWLISKQNYKVIIVIIWDYLLISMVLIAFNNRPMSLVWVSLISTLIKY